LTFQAVSSIFRSWYGTRYLTSIALRPTVKGSAFEASFAGENATLQEEADTTNLITSSLRAHETAGNSRKRQRASTSVTNDRQKKRTRCAAYDQLYNISKCWLVIKAIKPLD
jgi:hypothetical protein